MVCMDQKPSLQEMIDAVIKTFIVAHADDGDAHLAQALVYNAGRLAWRLREMGVSVEQKTSISDVVTDADRAAERFVAGVLEAVRPEDGLVGEEGTARESQSGRNWVIDPVDGTYNFTSGSDYWCSALALTDASGVALGAGAAITVRAITTAARGARGERFAHELRAVFQVGEDNLHGPLPQSGRAGDVCGGGVTAADRFFYLVCRAHRNNLSTWKTPTAKTQAVTSWSAKPMSVHFQPISRRCAATVATHGV